VAQTKFMPTIAPTTNITQHSPGKPGRSADTPSPALLTASLSGLMALARATYSLQRSMSSSACASPSYTNIARSKRGLKAHDTCLRKGLSVLTIGLLCMMTCMARISAVTATARPATECFTDSADCQ
jgi:hypothetical protein